MRTRTCTHEEGPRHDCDYVDARDQLVPLAAAVADVEEPEPRGATRPELAAWSWRWDAAYHRAMARLVAA